MIALPAQVTFATAARVLDDAVRAAQAELRAAGGPSPAAAETVGAGASPAPGIARAAGPLDIDLAGCQSFDSSVLAVLLELGRQASAAGTRCRLHRVLPNLRKLASLYGAEVLPFASSGAEGVQPA